MIVNGKSRGNSKVTRMKEIQENKNKSKLRETQK